MVRLLSPRMGGLWPAPLPESCGKTRSAAPARNVFGLLRRAFPQDSGNGAAARSAGPCGATSGKICGNPCQSVSKGGLPSIVRSNPLLCIPWRLQEQTCSTSRIASNRVLCPSPGPRDSSRALMTLCITNDQFPWVAANSGHQTSVRDMHG